MIKYLMTEGYSRMVIFDTKNEDISTVNYTRDNIDYIYIFPEDGVFDGKDVHKGDILFWMYPIGNRRDGKSEAIIVTDEKLKDFYQRLQRFYEEQELKRNNNMDCDCAEPCCEG